MLCQNCKPNKAIASCPIGRRRVCLSGFVLVTFSTGFPRVSHSHHLDRSWSRLKPESNAESFDLRVNSDCFHSRCRQRPDGSGALFPVRRRLNNKNTSLQISQQQNPIVITGFQQVEGSCTKMSRFRPESINNTKYP